jgi:cytochrome c oxidase subunit 2
MMTFARALSLVVLVAAPLAACGGDGDGTALSPEAEAGRAVFRSSGCASCHGPNGDGGVGPQLAGLWGSTVTLDDGSTVVADEAYLYESIADPGAKRVEGFGLRMPTNDLDDAEIRSILVYIEAIGSAGTDG